MKNKWIYRTSLASSYYECVVNGTKYFIYKEDYKDELSFDENLENCKKKMIVDKLNGKTNLYFSLIHYADEIQSRFYPE